MEIRITKVRNFVNIISIVLQKKFCEIMNSGKNFCDTMIYKHQIVDLVYSILKWWWFKSRFKGTLEQCPKSIFRRHKCISNKTKNLNNCLCSICYFRSYNLCIERLHQSDHWILTTNRASRNHCNRYHLHRNQLQFQHLWNKVIRMLTSCTLRWNSCR